MILDRFLEIVFVCVVRLIFLSEREDRIDMPRRFMDDLEREPLVKVMRLAKECGVKFAFGTDAHRVDVLSTISKGDAIADAVGITNDDIFELVK